MNDFINKATTTIDKNLPTILTGVSVVSGIATAVYSVYAGFQIKKAWDKLPEDATTLDKVKAAAPWVIGTATGITVSAGTAIAANHESGKRLAAAGLVVASTKLDMQKLQDKTKEILGEEKAKEVEEELKKDPKTANAYGNYISNKDKRMTFRDTNTGYFFRSSMRDIEYTKRKFNNELSLHKDDEGYTQSMAEFYDRLLGDDYDEIPVHTNVLFGEKFKDPKAMMLDIEYEYEVGPDMEPICAINYSYGEPDGTAVWC